MVHFCMFWSVTIFRAYFSLPSCGVIKHVTGFTAAIYGLVSYFKNHYL